MKHRILLAIIGMAALSMPASATSTFDFAACGQTVGGVTQTESSLCDSSGFSNTGTGKAGPFSQTINGLTVTATAYATDSKTNLNLVTGTSAVVGQYSGYGLGVCSTGDTAAGYHSSNPSAGCTPPYHQVNNYDNYEFVLFEFSAGVNLSSIQLANFGFNPGGASDMDMSYWTSTSSSVNPTTMSTLSTTGGFSNEASITYSGSTNPVTDSFSGSPINTSDVTYLLVGAMYGGDTTPDFFKIQDLAVSPVPAGNTVVLATPEPTTFGLIGLALTGLGLIARKRKAS